MRTQSTQRADQPPTTSELSSNENIQYKIRYAGF